MVNFTPLTNLETSGVDDLSSVGYFRAPSRQRVINLTLPPDVNTEIDNLKATVVKMIKAGVPVFFGCDVGKHSDNGLGIMDLKLFDYDVCILPRTHHSGRS